MVVAAAAAAASDEKSAVVREMTFIAPMILSDDFSTLQVVVEPGDGQGSSSLRLYCADSARGKGEAWTLHATATLERIEGPRDLADPRVDLERIKQRCREADCEVFYREMDQRGYEYQGAFRSIRQLWVGEREVLSRIEVAKE